MYISAHACTLLNISASLAVCTCAHAPWAPSQGGTCVLATPTPTILEAVPAGSPQKVVETQLEVANLDALGYVQLQEIAYQLILVVQQHMESKVPGVLVYPRGLPVKVPSRGRTLKATPGTVEVAYTVAFPKGTAVEAIEAASASYVEEVGVLVEAAPQASGVFNFLGVTKATAAASDAPPSTSPKGGNSGGGNSGVSVAIGVGVGVGVLVLVLVAVSAVVVVRAMSNSRVAVTPLSPTSGARAAQYAPGL